MEFIFNKGLSSNRLPVACNNKLPGTGNHRLKCLSYINICNIPVNNKNYALWNDSGVTRINNMPGKIPWGSEFVAKTGVLYFPVATIAVSA